MQQQNQDIFSILSEALSEGVIIVDKTQKIVGTNSSTNIMFGYDINELVGQPLQVLIPQKYHDKHGSHFKGYMKNSLKRQMGMERELYGIKKDGDTFPVEVGLNPFNIYGEKHVIALVTDITERKKAEQDLIHWAKIFDESLNEIFIFDTDSLHFIDVNRGALINIGYSLDELKKMTPVDIKPDFTEGEFRKILETLLNKTNEKIKFETVHERKDKSKYFVEVHLQLSKLGDREVFVAIILDISDRKDYTENLERTVEKRTAQLKEALAKEKELNELKTKFLSLVSHEFKTPLSGILTSTILLDKYKLSEQQDKRDKHIKTITSKVHYLNNILNDFLSIERLDSGKINYKFTNFNLSKVVNEVVYNANMLMKTGQHIRIPKNIDEYNLYQDEKILELALSNLMHNAIKYSPENTTIVLKIREKNKNIVFEIIDQGRGIPEKDQKYIFNRYFRAENALNDQGTGIGLNIVKGHLENLGGSINFTSEENKGSKFIFQIPISNE
jgi:PAS domain S-box-containing protein